MRGVMIYSQEQLAAVLEDISESQQPPHGMPECAECGDGVPSHEMSGVLCVECAEEEQEEYDRVMKEAGLDGKLPKKFQGGER